MHELIKNANGNFFEGRQVVTTDHGFGVRPNFQYVSYENAAVQYLATLGSKTSVITVRAKLNTMARFFEYPDIHNCEWEKMRYENVIKFLAYLRDEKQLSAGTINGYLCALKGVAQTAWNLGQILDHDLLRIKSIKQLRAYKKPTGRALTDRESKAIVKTTDGDDRRNIRDRAILTLLLGCGLRRAEITNIELKNVFMDEKRIRLIGKGNKERDVFMTDEVAKNVQAWIDLRLAVIQEWNKNSPFRTGNAGDGSGGYLFGRWTRGYAYLVINKPMNPWTVGNIVEQHRKAAGCAADITTHDLRRTYATRLLDKGIDIAVVKNMMGHASIGTTALYDRRGDDAMREATKKVEI